MKDLIKALEKAKKSYTGVLVDAYILGAAKGALDYKIIENPDKTYTAKEVLELLEFITNAIDA